MADLDFFLLEITFPELFHSIQNLHKFDRKIADFIDSKYGKDSLQSIILLQEYNKEIENVQNGIITNSRFGKAAQKYNTYYQTFNLESIKLAHILGYQQASSIIHQMQDGFRGVTKSLDTSFMDDYLKYFNQ